MRVEKSCITEALYLPTIGRGEESAMSRPPGDDGRTQGPVVLSL